MVPYASITFSKRDNISLSIGQFEQLLVNPKDFEKNYFYKKTGEVPGQIKMYTGDEQ